MHWRKRNVGCLLSYCFLLLVVAAHGWGCSKAEEANVAPDQFKNVTIYDWDPIRNGVPGPEDRSTIPHAEIGQARTKRIFGEVSYRKASTWFKGPYLGIAQLEDGSECHLVINHWAEGIGGGGVGGWENKFGIIGQAGHYLPSPDGENELNRIMWIAEGRYFVFMRSRLKERKEEPSPAWLDGKYGYVDNSGKVVIPPRFDDALPFSEGFAAIRIGDADTGKWGFINEKGEVVVEPRFAGASFFLGGLAIVTVDDYFDGKRGYIDTRGEMVIAARFDHAGEFSGGFAVVASGGRWQDGGDVEWHRIDRTGKFVDARDFSEGLAASKKGKQWGYLDKSGRWIIEPQFDDAGDFSGGRARVEKEGKVLFIDKDGEVVSPEDPRP